MKTYNGRFIFKSKGAALVKFIHSNQNQTILNTALSLIDIFPSIILVKSELTDIEFVF